MPGFAIPGGGGARNGAPSSLRETARKHRWIFEIEPRQGASRSSLDQLGFTIYAHKATRPSPEIDAVTIHHSQDEIYTPGKNRWAPIEVSFYEVLGRNGNITADFIYQWWSRDVLQFTKSRIAGVGGNKIKRRCVLTQLNGYGRAVHCYILYGAWPEKVTPDDLNYDDSAICEITIRLRYDKAAEHVVSNPDAPTSSGSPSDPGSPRYPNLEPGHEHPSVPGLVG